MKSSHEDKVKSQKEREVSENNGVNESESTLEDNLKEILKIELNLINDKNLDIKKNNGKKGINSLKERLKNYILYAIGRLDYYEKLSNSFASFAITLLIVLVPVLTFLLNLSLTLDILVFKLYLIPLFFGLFSFLILAMLNIITYGRKSATDYPYRKVANVLWYFKYNVEVKKNLPLKIF